MLLDEYLPNYDFTEVHTIRISAAPETVYRAIKETTLTEISGIVRLLLTLRELPEKIVGREGFRIEDDKPLLDTGFIPLLKQPPHEFVVGMIVPAKIGRIWQKSSRLDGPVADAGEYAVFNHPDYLKVVMNMLVEPAPDPGVVIVRTESRTKGLSDNARKSFRPYWAVIRPWSGLIRRLWLKAIKKRAENRHQ